MDQTSMSSIKSIHETAIPDNPLAPDVFHLGKSRIGSKLARKALDAYHKAKRRVTGVRATYGPPVPNSEKHGRREYYIYFQTVKGGVHSGYVRNLRAQPKHKRVMSLRAWGFTIRAIAAIVGYSMRHVRRILHTPRRTLAQRWADAKARLARLTGGGHEHSSHRAGVRVWEWSECRGCGRIALDRKQSRCCCGSGLPMSHHYGHLEQA